MFIFVQKLAANLLLLVLISCNSDPEFQEITINKTIKVYSQTYHNDSENYTFKWEPPLGPTKETISFDIKNQIN